MKETQSPGEFYIFDQSSAGKRNCKYLGTYEDRGTCFQFPHESNSCFKTGDAQEIALDFQQGTCLSTRHTKCDVFQGYWNGVYPANALSGVSTSFSG